jgi:hypothetical protein
VSKLQNDYPFLNAYRYIAYGIAVLSIVGGVLVICSTFNQLGRMPFLSVVITLAAPFIAGLGAAASGDMFGLLLELRDRSLQQQSPRPNDAMAAAVRELTKEVRILQAQVIPDMSTALASSEAKSRVSTVKNEPFASARSAGIPVEVAVDRYDLRTSPGGQVFESKSGLRIPVTGGSSVRVVGRAEDNQWYLVQVNDIGQLWIEAAALNLPDDPTLLANLPVV